MYGVWPGAVTDVRAEHHADPRYEPPKLTEIVWRHGAAQLADPDVREVIEGEFAARPPLDQLPHSSAIRYDSMQEVMRLIELTGDVRNLFAAFFLGEIAKIAGTIEAAGRPGVAGMRLEDKRAPYAAQWREELDRLAAHAPAPDLDKWQEGFPADRAEAFCLAKVGEPREDFRKRSR
jgi:hypothetical protein